MLRHPADTPAAGPGGGRYHGSVALYDSRTALLVVDMQNDFADPAGTLSVRHGHRILPFVNEQVGAALAAGARVLYTQDWHPPSTPHFAKDGGIWPVHCVAGTWGAELYPGLAVRGAVVRKGTGGEDGYSGFSMHDHAIGETVPTELHDLLQEAGVSRVVIVGLATDYCVKATGLDARELGYETTVLAAGVRAVDLVPGDGERALDDLRAAGVAVIDEDATA